MLTELSVENFALVEKLSLTFGSGLNLLTGETGAGKSILLDALGMALGERTGAEVVRHGADRARVEAVFTIDEADRRLREAMSSAGIDADEGVVIVSREMTAAGKSTVRINGRAATVGMLKGIGDALVDIHGQHEHQSLLAVERHADLLDAWGGPEIAALKAAVAAAAEVAQATARELAGLQQDARERARMIDLLAFQAAEIEDAAPQAGEDDALQAERLRLSSAERLHEAAATAVAALQGGGDRAGRNGARYSGGAETPAGALESLSNAIAAVDQAAKLDAELAPILNALRNALYVAEDAARDVRAYGDQIEFNPERLEEIENRVETLKRLKKKYGDTLEDVLRYRDDTVSRLETLQNAEERISELQAEADRTRDELAARAARLTRARQKVAKPFAAAILKELADLAMGATRFDVAIEPRPVGPRGADHVEFLLSPNPGEPLKPLARIASGGEISRVMLALKSVLARTYRIPTLVFDEIDTGIGGRTGAVLADKLDALSRSVQVLCITHLPQIAARGDRHFFIEKSAAKNRTTIRVEALSHAERVEEIARMLGGARITETVRQHAREMLGNAAPSVDASAASTPRETAAV
jgi:DNA repair protein RecN (Recombination protein N)